MRNYFFWILLIFIAATSGCSSDSPSDPPSCPSGTDWSFVVIANTRSRHDIFATHVSNILKLSPRPEFLLHGGDMITLRDIDLEWQTFHQVIQPIWDTIPVYGAVGNHDVSQATTGGRPQYTRDLFRRQMDIKGKLYYAVPYKSFLFLVLDTYEIGQYNEIVGDQLAWLKDQLANAGGKHVVILTHKPLDPGLGTLNADELHTLFLQYNVTAAFAGHINLFRFTVLDGFPYVITAGGGAPLNQNHTGAFYNFVRVCTQADKMEVQVIDLDGSLAETHSITLKNGGPGKDAPDDVTGISAPMSYAGTEVDDAQ